MYFLLSSFSLCLLGSCIFSNLIYMISLLTLSLIHISASTSLDFSPPESELIRFEAFAPPNRYMPSVFLNSFSTSAGKSSVNIGNLRVCFGILRFFCLLFTASCFGFSHCFTPCRLCLYFCFFLTHNQFSADLVLRMLLIYRFHIIDRFVSCLLYTSHFHLIHQRINTVIYLIIYHRIAVISDIRICRNTLWHLIQFCLLYTSILP